MFIRRKNVVKLDKFDFLSGTVTHILDEPDEDMLIVVYPNQHYMDVGWYGGKFVICLMKDCAWNMPIAVYHAKTKKELYMLLPKAIEKIDYESNHNRAYYGPLWKTEVITAESLGLKKTKFLK